MPVFSASSIPSLPLLSMWRPCLSVLVLWDMQVFLDSGPLYVGSILFLRGVLPSFLIWGFFLFRLQLKQPPSQTSPSQPPVLKYHPFCVSSFFCSVILCWNVSVWWAGTFLFSLCIFSSSCRAWFSEIHQPHFQVQSIKAE